MSFQDLLDEVVEQKWAIEGLIRASWAYLDHDADTLLYFDIADIESTWYRLKEKLRRLGEPPWNPSKGAARTANQIRELDPCYFATRKDHRHQRKQKPRSRKKNHPAVDSPSLVDTTEADSFPCALLSLSSHSLCSSDNLLVAEEEEKVEENQRLSENSSDFEFSSKSFASESSTFSSISASTEDQVLVSHSTESFSQREDLPTLTTEKAFQIIQKEGSSSLPNLLYCHRHTAKSCERKRQKNRKPERIFYSTNYSASESDEASYYLDNSSSDPDSSIIGSGSGNFTNGSHFRLSSFEHQRPPVSTSEGRLLASKVLYPSSFANLSMEIPQQPTSKMAGKPLPVPARHGNSGSGRSSPSSGRSSPLGVRSATPLGVDDSPVLQKRRRMNHDHPYSGDVTSLSGGSSPRDSPSSLHLMLNPGISLGVSSMGSSMSFDDTSFDDLSDSQLSSPDTPTTPSGMDHTTRAQKKDRLRGRYRKDELWAAIRSDYHYLMDGEIIETCKVGTLLISLKQNLLTYL